MKAAEANEMTRMERARVHASIVNSVEATYRDAIRTNAKAGRGSMKLPKIPFVGGPLPDEVLTFVFERLTRDGYAVDREEGTVSWCEPDADEAADPVRLMVEALNAAQEEFPSNSLLIAGYRPAFGVLDPDAFRVRLSMVRADDPAAQWDTTFYQAPWPCSSSERKALRNRITDAVVAFVLEHTAEPHRVPAGWTVSKPFDTSSYRLTAPAESPRGQFAVPVAADFEPAPAVRIS